MCLFFKFALSFAYHPRHFALSVTFLIANSCSGVENISLDACPAVRQERKMQLNYRLRDYTGVFDIGYVQFTFSFYVLNYM